MLLVAASCAPLATPADAPIAAPPTMLLVATRLAPGAVASWLAVAVAIAPIGVTPMGEYPIMVYGAAMAVKLVTVKPETAPWKL